MTTPPNGPFVLVEPQVASVPLVLDSPHSGDWIPAGLPLAVSEWDLRESEDSFVDQLWAEAPAHGATLLAATFSRAYVDPNRHAGDVDPELLDGPWPHPMSPSGKARIGKAVVWRTLEDGRPIHTRRLAAAEVAARIDGCLLPYQQALAALIDAAHARHGVCFHVNCHSMRAVAGPMGEGGSGTARADIVLGDRDGSTCSAEFTALVRDTLSGFGYDVRINDPYKGVELVRVSGDPARGRHSLQLELNKRLYMDEATRRRTAGFDVLRRDLNRLLATLADHARHASR
ncbi:MAG: N-formylglutamate amidohydrolase [Burkholderiales bacterium]|nr:MAG: N-formylglutamate amidohydrolase [Burkholderiales bacterium]